ncbi:MAG: redoxin domain-containing protein [Lachnospiraceae bacterium]|nr:redoxin domain-containing protein [Lachnospiraceae bacterium]
MKKECHFLSKALTAILFTFILCALAGCISVFAAGKLSAPKLTGKGSSAKTVTLKWDEVKGADGYNIYKYNSPKKKYKLVGSIDASTCIYEISNLKSGKTYKFKVAAFTEENGKKTVGKKSKVAKVKTLTNISFPADDFTVYDENGKKHKLSDYAGMPVIVNIWATWCGPCVSELPHFSKLYKEYGDKIKFFMLNCEDRGDVEYVKSFVDYYGYSFPVYYDFDDNASRAYGTGYIPMNIVFTASGQIIYCDSGSLDESYLKYLLDSAIAG